MNRRVFSTGMVAGVILMSAPVFAQTGTGVLSPAEPAFMTHPSLFPFQVAAVAAGVPERPTGSAIAGGAGEHEGVTWHPALYPFVIAGAQRDVAQRMPHNLTTAPAHESTIWHPALFPFGIAGR